MEVTLAYFMPVIIFLLVFIVIYALLSKTKILGSNNFIHLFVSFLISAVFIASPALIDVTRLSLPWVALFIIVLFCMLLVLSSVWSLDKVKNPKIALITVVVILVIFLISAINVFGPIIRPYLPTATSEAGAVPEILQVKHVIFNPSVVGMIVLLIVAAIASWVLTKK